MSAAQDTSSRLRSALAGVTAALTDAGIVSASAESRRILQHAAGTERHLALLDELPADFEERVERILDRRCRREPLQLILGRAPFRRLELTVRPGVFVPRPETELIIDLLCEELQGPCRTVADLCTGTGAIAAALLDELPAVRVIAVELDPAALEVASENLAPHLESRRGRLLEADVTDSEALEELAGLDAVLSNPPYIPADAVPVDPEVREHDPHRALYGGGADGLEVPAAIIARAVRLLRPGGLLLMEHADVQGASTRELARSTGAFDEVRTAPDLTGRDRFLVARRGTGLPDGSEVRD